MSHPQRILLQTTLLAGTADDWTIETFSLLQDFLRTGLREPAFVTARDRQPEAQGNDPVLSQLDRQDFDQLWLFALDVGDGLSPADAAGINRFHEVSSPWRFITRPVAAVMGIVPRPGIFAHAT